MDPEEKFKPWSNSSAPRKVLAIRYQALGDVVITLPYLNDLKKQFPHTQLHLLTREEVCSIPLSLALFDKVIAIGGGRNAKLQFILTLLKLPLLMLGGYDVVLDLQNHRISRFVVKMLRPKAWCIFDKHSNKSAAVRTKNAIEGCLKIKINLAPSFIQNLDEAKLQHLLTQNWHKENSDLIVFNPAGAFDTRHWPLANYVALASLFKRENSRVQFLILGLKNKLSDSTSFLKKHLGDDLVDLTDRTTAAESFALLRKSKLVVTEDSGLMHMAWVQAVPTLAIFGSSRSDWSSPQGAWSVCLNSSDLPCGNCLLEVCKYEDNHCLTRYSPEFVFEKSMQLLAALKN